MWGLLPVEDLPELALDILAATYAPAINPNVALLFQDLQQASGAQPSMAFLHRLLAFNDQEYALAQQLALEQGELAGRGLLLSEGEGPMQQLQPHPAVLPVFSGLPQRRLRSPARCPSIYWRVGMN